MKKFKLTGSRDNLKILQNAWKAWQKKKRDEKKKEEEEEQQSQQLGGGGAVLALVANAIANAGAKPSPTPGPSVVFQESEWKKVSSHMEYKRWRTSSTVGGSKYPTMVQAKAACMELAEE